jgi:hypothetical protein
VLRRYRCIHAIGPELRPLFVDLGRISLELLDRLSPETILRGTADQSKDYQVKQVRRVLIKYKLGEAL